MLAVFVINNYPKLVRSCDLIIVLIAVSLTFFTMDSYESFCAVANSTTSSVNAGSLMLTFDLITCGRVIW